MVSSTVFSQNYFYALDEEPTAPDTENPKSPINLVASNITTTSVDLDWGAATDNTAITNYSVFKDGVLETTLGNVLTYQVTSLNASTSYDFTVTAIDGSGNESLASNTVTITTNTPNEVTEVRFIIVGASIMQAAFGSGGMANFLAVLQNTWPDKTFSAFRHALSGQTMCSYVDSNIPNIDDTLSQYEPIAGVETIVLIHLGGNDVTSGRPYSGESQNDLTSMTACYTEILDKIDAKGFKPLICDISFRNYDEGTPNNAYENEELGSKPYNDNIVIPLAFNRTEFRYDDGEPFMQFYNMSYNNWETYLGNDNIHVAGSGLTAFRDRIINEICDYIFNGTVPPRIIKNTPSASLTNNMVSEQKYFDAVLLPLTKKDSLQDYIDLYDHIRLEKGDYGRLNGQQINLTTNQSLYGFPTETNTPEINVLAGSSNVTIHNINPHRVHLLAGSPITHITIGSLSNSTILSTGGQIEDNLFLNIARSGIELDFSVSGYYRNNRVYRHQTQGSFLELLGNSTTPSYGNVHVWNNFLTPSGDAAYINNIEDISFLGLDSEGWNLRNQTTRNAMFKAENIGNIKITDLGGANGYCEGCEQPALDIQADNLFIFNKKISDAFGDKSIIRANTNLFILEENWERDPYRKEAGVYDVKLSTEYGLGIYDDNSVYINDVLVTETLTDQTTIDKIKENILQPQFTPVDRPVHEVLPDPLGPNWATEREGKPDSRAYIQNLIDTDTIAQLPEGVFYISGTLNINGDDNFKGGIIGAGTGKTVICGLTDDFPLITVNKFNFAENQQSRINLAHLTLQGGDVGLYFPTNLRLTSLNSWRYVIFRNQNTGIYLEQIFGLDNCFFDHLSFINCDKGIWNDPLPPSDPNYEVLEYAGYIDKVVFYKNQFIGCNVAMQISSDRGSNLNAWIECNFDSNGSVATMGGQNFAQFVNCDFTNNTGGTLTGGALFNGSGPSFYNCVFSGNTSTLTFDTVGLLAEGCSFLDTNQLMGDETHFNQSQYIINSTVNATTLGGGWGNNQSQFINTSFPNIPALNKLMVNMKDNVITTIIDEAPNPYPQFFIKH
ncbi:hypothetical protein GCM10023315_28990 [Algibacter aquimarinus]|uniref:Fibronectin type-III domain-containing protein n=2 Tax=Algibacter aquimarinus TaxID=1136748 RepID=A0ABP9HQM7_9FLAO